MSRAAPQSRPSEKCCTWVPQNSNTSCFSQTLHVKPGFFCPVEGSHLPCSQDLLEKHMLAEERSIWRALNPVDSP